MYSVASLSSSVFLSTLSLRRATWEHTTPPPGAWNFYPRSPCGERRCAEGFLVSVSLFLSTLSLRRATPLLAVLPAWRNHFYPRSPCGERRSSTTAFSVLSYFYPRSPCGERLRPIEVPQYHILISIHALLAESDHIYTHPISITSGISIHALLAESDP